MMSTLWKSDENISTISTYAGSVFTDYTAVTSTTIMKNLLTSTIVGINYYISPYISTQNSILKNFSTYLYSTLKTETSTLKSTTSSYIYRFLLQNTNNYKNFSTILQQTPLTISTLYSQQHGVYSTILQNNLSSQIGVYTSSSIYTLSTAIGAQFSTIKNDVNGLFLSTASTGLTLVNNQISNQAGYFSTTLEINRSSVQSTFDTSKLFYDLININSSNLSTSQSTYINTLSASIGFLYQYSTIQRSQTFFEVDLFYNNSPISTLIYTSSLSPTQFSTLSTTLFNFLSTQYITNSTQISADYTSNVSNAYYTIVKALRANSNASTVSSAYSYYSSQVASTYIQNYRFTVLSEALDIADTSSTATSVFTPNTVNTSNIHLVASGIQTLQGQMTTLTSTNFITLLTYTFDKYRYESEQTLRILNKNEAQQSTTMNQLATKLTDTVYGDIYYSNISTYAYTMYSTTQSGLSNIMTSTINTVSYSVNYSSFMSTLSTYYVGFPSTTYLKNTSNLNSNLSSLLSTAYHTNISTLSTQSSLVKVFASSISSYLRGVYFVSLSTIMRSNYETTSTFAITISNILQDQTDTVSNYILNYQLGGLIPMSNYVVAQNTYRETLLNTIYSNSLSLNVIDQPLSTFKTLSSIYINAPFSTPQAFAVMNSTIQYPLTIDFYDRTSKTNMLFVNSSLNEVIARRIRVEGLYSTYMSTPTNTKYLDFYKYQNFDVNIGGYTGRTDIVLSNSLVGYHYQVGDIALHLSTPTQTEFLWGKTVELYGTTEKYPITNKKGLLRYKYNTGYIQYGQFPLASYHDFTEPVYTYYKEIIMGGAGTSAYVSIVYDFSTHRLFLLDKTAKDIVIMSYKVTQTFTNIGYSFSDPWSIVLAPTNDYMYVTDTAGYVYKAAVPTYAAPTVVTSSIVGPCGIAINSAGTILYVSGNTTKIYRVVIATGVTTELVDINYLAQGLSLDPTGTLLWITILNTHDIYTYNLTTGYLNTGLNRSYDRNSLLGLSTSYIVSFMHPRMIATDSYSNAFVADPETSQVRRLNPFDLFIDNPTYTITSIAGSEGLYGNADGLDTSARFSTLYGITTGPSNQVWVADANMVSRLIPVKYPFVYPNRGLSFSGASHLELSPGFILGSLSFTIEFWFFITLSTSTANSAFIGTTNSTGIRMVTNGDTIRFTSPSVGGPDDFTLYDNQLTPITIDSLIGVWAHCAISRRPMGSQNSWNLWLNGIQSGVQFKSTKNFTGATNYIGFDNVDQIFMHGSIANLRVVTGTYLYDPQGGNITVPSLPLQKISGTQYLATVQPNTIDSAGVQQVTNYGVGVTEYYP